jgi:hypothetical protein
LLVYQTSSGTKFPYFLEKVSDTSFPRLPVFGGIPSEENRPDKNELESTEYAGEL